MASSNKTSNSASKQAFYTFWILVLFLLVILYYMIENSSPAPTYSIASLSDNLQLAWYLEEGFGSFVSSEDGIIFALPVERDRLFAIDANTGAVKWVVELPFPKGGMRVFLADSSSVYIVTAIDVTAYSSDNGEILWETELGDGHVSIEANIANDVMEIHYGDESYEIDLPSGELLSKRYNVNSGFDPIFRIIKNRILLTNSNSSDGLCAQQLSPRKVLWCKNGFELDEIAVDEECEIGYAMPSDEVLWVIDLFTGDVLATAKFKRIIGDEPKGYFSKLHFANDMIVVSFSGQSYGVRNDFLCSINSSKP